MASNFLRTDEGATSIGGLARNAAIGTVVAVVAVVVVFLVAKATGSDLELTPAGQDAPIELSVGFPIFATIVGGIVGALLALVVGKFAPSPPNTFIAICVIGLIAYGAYAFSAAEGTATAIWLNVMHIAAAIPIVGALLPSTR